MNDRDTLNTILTQVKAHLPYAKLDYLDDTAPSASVQQLFGTRITEPHIMGGGTGELPFAVLLRVKNKDSKTRLDAASTLYALLDDLNGFEGGDISDIDAQGTPVKEFADEHTEVWRVQLTAVVERSADEIS